VDLAVAGVLDGDVVLRHHELVAAHVHLVEVGLARDHAAQRRRLRCRRVPLLSPIKEAKEDAPGRRANSETFICASSRSSGGDRSRAEPVVGDVERDELHDADVDVVVVAADAFERFK